MPAQLTIDGREDRWPAFNAHVAAQRKAPQGALFDSAGFRDLTYSGKCSQPAMLEVRDE